MFQARERVAFRPASRSDALLLQQPQEGAQEGHICAQSVAWSSHANLQKDTRRTAASHLISQLECAQVLRPAAPGRAGSTARPPVPQIFASIERRHTAQTTR